MSVCLQEKPNWNVLWTIEEYHTKDVNDLEHIVEYYDTNNDLKESGVLRGQDEVKYYLGWLERMGLMFPNAPLSKKAKAKCISTPDILRKHPLNLLCYAGMSCIWETLIGNGTASAGQSLTYFSNANAAIGVGDSTTAAAATQTDLQAASNKLRVGMNSTYPQHTDGVTSGSATITFQSTFGNSQANYSWNEVGVFNSATAATGRMLNRLVQNLGTKSAGAWSLGCAVTLS